MNADPEPRMLLSLRSVYVTFGPERAPVHALSNCSFELGYGEFLAVTGRSGSGKTTLLNVVGILDRPTEGEYYFAETNTAGLDEKEQSALRATRIGFVFQEAHLIGARTVLENVELGLRYAGVGRRARPQLAREVLEQVGMSHRISALPSTLSAGERQRVAIARALVKRPQLLVCDEPTGNLDTTNARAVMELVEDIPRRGCSVLLVTHDRLIAERAPRRIELSDGQITEDSLTKQRRRNTALTAIPPAVKASRRARTADYLDDIGLTFQRRPWRAVLASAGVLLAVGLFVFSIALATTAATRIQREFDVLAATGLRVSSAGSDGNSVHLTEATGDDVGKLAGVVAAGTTWSVGALSLKPGPGAWVHETYRVEVNAFSAGALRTLRPTLQGSGLRNADFRLGTGTALIGSALQEKFDTPLAEGSEILIGGEQFEVVGIIEDVERNPDSLFRVIIPTRTAERLWPSRHDSDAILVEVEVGSVEIIAEEAPLVVSPERPEALTALYQPEAKRLRQSVSGQVDALASVLSVALLVVGGFGIGNSSLTSVIERRHEIGVRRALGARRADILRLFLGETTLHGSIASLSGFVLAIAAFLALSGVRRWAPVLALPEIALIPLAGAAAGLLAGVLPAMHASRLAPVDALRS